MPVWTERTWTVICCFQGKWKLVTSQRTALTLCEACLSYHVCCLCTRQDICWLVTMAMRRSRMLPLSFLLYRTSVLTARDSSLSLNASLIGGLGRLVLSWPKGHSRSVCRLVTVSLWTTLSNPRVGASRAKCNLCGWRKDYLCLL